MANQEKTPAEDTIKGEHQPYEEEKAVGGAPRGYDAEHERYDENGDRIYKRDADHAPADKEAEDEKV